MAEPAPESRRALIRRMYHDERCNIAEIAGYLRCCQADVRWALGFSGRSQTSKRLRARILKWTTGKTPACGPLSPSLGLRVAEFRAEVRHG